MILLDKIRCGLLNEVSDIVWVDNFLFFESPKKLKLKLWVKGSGKNVIVVDHHIAHLASCFYASDFDESAVVSIDGKGDNSSCKIAYGQDTKLIELSSVPME